MRSRIQPGDGDPRHGTTNGYGNLGCHCGDCRRAWAAYCLPYQAVYRRHRTRGRVQRREANAQAIAELLAARGQS